MRPSVLELERQRQADLSSSRSHKESLSQNNNKTKQKENQKSSWPTLAVSWVPGQQRVNGKTLSQKQQKAKWISSAKLLKVFTNIYNFTDCCKRKCSYLVVSQIIKLHMEVCSNTIFWVCTVKMGTLLIKTKRINQSSSCSPELNYAIWCPQAP